MRRLSSGSDREFEGFRVPSVHSRGSSPVRPPPSALDRSADVSDWASTTAEVVDSAMRSFEERTKAARAVPRSPLMERHSLQSRLQVALLSTPYKAPLALEEPSSLGNVENEVLRHRLAALQADYDRARTQVDEHADALTKSRSRSEQLLRERDTTHAAYLALQREAAGFRKRMEALELSAKTHESVEGLQSMLHRALQEKAALFEELDTVRGLFPPPPPLHPRSAPTTSHRVPVVPLAAAGTGVSAAAVRRGRQRWPQLRQAPHRGAGQHARVRGAAEDGRERLSNVGEATEQ